MTFPKTSAARLAGFALLASLAACASPSGDAPARYKTISGKAPSLDLPPDISQLRGAQREAPATTASVMASDYQSGVRDAPLPVTATDTLGDVRIEGEGRQHWLVVGRTPEQLWSPLREFWQDNGFLVVLDQPKLGIMETDWSESRAKLPQDIVRDTLGKLAETQHATAELDRFRTRLERAPDGSTEIFISHRGMREAVKVTRSGEDKVWDTEPVDADLETEVLRRLMAQLGDPKNAQASVHVSPVAAVRTAAVGQPTLELAEGFDLAWRHVGLALDRTGFTVEDRDRSAGTYYVRYVPPNPNRMEPGAFDKLFELVKPKPVEAPLKLGIVVKSQANASTVSVVSAQGVPDQSANAQRIVQVIAADLR